MKKVILLKIVESFEDLIKRNIKYKIALRRVSKVVYSFFNNKKIELETKLL